jgi:hypothetical protein
VVDYAEGHLPEVGLLSQMLLDRITEVVKNNRDFFSHVPDEFIVAGEWHDVHGPKTAVKPHDYKGVDFPKHFNSTRCVFAFDDGACSLQVFSAKFTSSPWTYKTRTCVLFPLEVKDGQGQPPPLLPQDDQTHIGLSYPGFSVSLPCAQHRQDGTDWDIVLKSELEYLVGESAATLVDAERKKTTRFAGVSSSPSSAKDPKGSE